MALALVSFRMWCWAALKIFLICLWLLVDLGLWDPARSIELALAINPVKISALNIFRVSSYDHCTVFTLFFFTLPHPRPSATPRRPLGSPPRPSADSRWPHLFYLFWNLKYTSGCLSREHSHHSVFADSKCYLNGRSSTRWGQVGVMRCRGSKRHPSPDISIGNTCHNWVIRTVEMCGIRDVLSRTWRRVQTIAHNWRLECPT